MFNYDGTFNQIVKGQHGKFGGALVVFEGHPQLLVGGFNYDLKDLPKPGNVLPCGTPVNCDEQTRKITPVITAKVKSVSGSDIVLEDNGFGQTALESGVAVGILPEDLNSAVAKSGVIITKDGLNIKLASPISDLKAGDILVQVSASTNKIKAIPNALTPYDVVYDADAVSVDGDGMIGNDRPLLERRMPPINDAIKAAVQANGHKLTFSNRK